MSDVVFLPSPARTVLALVLAALAAVAFFDAKHRRIPNELVAAIALGGLVHATLRGGARGASGALLGAVVGMALLLWQFRRGLMGAGDVKLLGALGAWTGAGGVCAVLLLGTLLGGVLGLLWMIRLPHRERADVRRNMTKAASVRPLDVPEPGRLTRARGVPYGIALAAAGAMVLSIRAFR